jgi:3-oxoacyl-[acyl-carrier protein] reductase
MDPEKQIALVTGASRGIGRAVAVALARGGRHVAVNFRSREEDARETLRQIEETPGSGELAPFDVTDGGAVAAAMQGLLERHDRIDILVNNAGLTRDMLMVWMKPEDWHPVLDVKLGAFFYVTNSVLRTMVEKRFGRIINIASTAGLTGIAGQVNYSAANAGLIGATRALAKEVAKRGITVNAIAPGFIKTEMLGGLDLKQLAKTIPAARVGSPEDVAAVAAFLASGEAGYITGQVIGVNGGVF